ncbi:hypothetical protein Tco_0039757 [Tanacetum coccineum]
MTKVIKGEFEKHEDLKVKDVSLTCNTSLEVFNNEFNRLSRMDDDLFTYEVEIANILCDSNKDDDSKQRMSHEADDDMRYDPSDIRGDGEVELTNEEFSDNEDEVAETYLLRTLRDSRLMMNIRMIGSMNGTKIYHRLMRNHGLKLEFGQNQNHAYHIGNSLHYQDLEWYEALEDSKLKEKALRNKAIMDGLINDDESSNDCWKRWKSHEIYYHNYDEGEYENETHKKDMSYVVSKLAR